jgi:hypothetical protein
MFSYLQRPLEALQYVSGHPTPLTTVGIVIELGFLVLHRRWSFLGMLWYRIAPRSVQLPQSAP